ncbi:hypothetical protein [Kordia jejudonensis]|uniref:hypothetical protein n=1 Tax=Kordia jejudonensis TaxID=1348245 RepID=UPI00062907F6|nr:hypothetical protein [Kordia jejudonensis]
MSNGIKRIGKGMLAIFLIKLSLVVIVFVFQACQTDSLVYEQNEEAKNNFLSALQLSNEKLNEIVINPTRTINDDKNDGVMKENSDGITTFKMCLLLNQDDANASNNTGVVDPTNVATIGDVINVGNQSGERPVVVDDTTNEPIDGTPVDFGFSMCFDIPAEPTQDALAPSIIEAKNYFYSRNFNDADIVEMLDGEDESMLVPLVLEIMVLTEIDESNNATAFNMSTLFGNSLHAQSTTSKSWNCLMRALGVSTLVESFQSIKNGNKAILKKVGKKAIKKLASRFLGPIGAAIAIIDFVICMNENQ